MDLNLLQESVFELAQDIDDNRREIYSWIDSLNNSLLHLKEWINDKDVANREHAARTLNSSIFLLADEFFDIASNLERTLSSVNLSLFDLHEKNLAQIKELHRHTNVIEDMYGVFYGRSCSSILLTNTSSPSGFYWLRSTNSSFVRVYCDMTRTCGNITGGWMRVAELDMTNATAECPESLCLNYSIPRTCRLCMYRGGCSSEIYSVGVTYSRVCGQIIGYQIGSPDEFLSGEELSVDGVKLTHDLRRDHIWTFAATSREALTYKQSYCPCTAGLNDNVALPPHSYFGTFCAVGNMNDDHDSGMFYTDDPLWDGLGCQGGNQCVSFNNPRGSIGSCLMQPQMTSR